MGKQHTQRLIAQGQDFISRSISEHSAGDSRVVAIFTEHFNLSRESMSPEAAAHTAYTAVVNHLASLKETQDGDPMR